MTKAYTRRAKLAAKRAARNAAGLPDIAPIPKSNPQPRDNGRFGKRAEETPTTALDARCRRFGIAADTKGRTIARGQHMGCDLGFVLERLCRADERAALWDVFARWCRAEATYRTRYLGQGEQPASAALTMVPDDMGTDPGHTVDVRTPDERDRDAVSSWMRWQGYLGHLSASSRTILHHARRGDGPALWVGGKSTRHGQAALDALRGLADAAGR